MINEITNANDQQGQVNKPGSRHKDIQGAGTQTGKSGEFDIHDVVEISQLKPVQPVSEDKNDIHFSSDAKNAEKNTDILGPKEIFTNTTNASNATEDSQNSVYGKRESEIGKFIDTVA